MSQPLIELQNLTKYFDVGKDAKLHAVDGVSLTINQGAVSYTHLDVYKRQDEAHVADADSAV